MEDTLAKFSAVLDGDLTGHSGPPVCIDLAEDATPKILGCRVALRDVDLGVDNDLGVASLYAMSTHSVGVLFYGIVSTYGVSRKDASWPLVLSQSLSFLAGGAAVSACFFADSILYLNILFGIVYEFASMSVAVNAISFSLVAFGMSTFLLLSVDIAVDKGIMPSSGVFLLNAFAVADIATRPLSGVVIDSGLLTLESVMLLGYVLQLLALELFVWLDAFPLLLASSVIFGVSNGSRITLLPPFLAKEFGVDRMPGLLGGVSFWSGVVLISGPFLVGYWRDNLGSYDGILHFVAALNAAVAVIWVAKLY
ncbi:uncharacterized protein LOC119377430, partial [Rhipicephalus sanguineus]|uniref:uncharacterized protein LOC119377430 n=1 Tax=Rhipicephalus sanguineus TaxID=34632 RepID=UPI0020C36B3D